MINEAHNDRIWDIILRAEPAIQQASRRLNNPSDREDCASYIREYLYNKLSSDRGFFHIKEVYKLISYGNMHYCTKLRRRAAREVHMDCVTELMNKGLL